MISGGIFFYIGLFVGFEGGVFNLKRDGVWGNFVIRGLFVVEFRGTEGIELRYVWFLFFEVYN